MVVKYLQNCMLLLNNIKENKEGEKEWGKRQTGTNKYEKERMVKKADDCMQGFLKGHNLSHLLQLSMLDWPLLLWVKSPLLIEFTNRVTSLLWVWRTMLHITENLMTALGWMKGRTADGWMAGHRSREDTQEVKIDRQTDRSMVEWKERRKEKVHHFLTMMKQVVVE